MVEEKGKIFFGRIYHSLSWKELVILHAAALGVGDDGKILFLDDKVKSGAEAAKKHHLEGAKIITLGKLQFLFPGLVDCHFHSSQYPNLGWGTQYNLQDWRNALTEKIESTFKSPERAKSVYDSMVPKVLENGTTCVAYNSTIHVEATKILADTCLKYGQRAIIGKYCIDTDAPEYNIEHDTEMTLKGVSECVEYIRKIDPDAKLLYPCIEPRHGGSVSPPLMSGLGKLSQKGKDKPIHVQSHLGEAQSSIDATLRVYPNTKSQAHVFYDRGLLHERTILAHCCHLAQLDMEMLRDHRAGVSHCPASNTNLRDGECRVKWLLENNVKVGLGTDCSAGHTISILINMREAMSTSHHLVIHTKDEKHDRLDVEDVVFLGTLGGAQVCDVDTRIGNFLPGKEFDGLLIDVGIHANVDVSDYAGNDLAILHKWIMNGDDRSIRRVFCNGREVAGKDFMETGFL